MGGVFSQRPTHATGVSSPPLLANVNPVRITRFGTIAVLSVSETALCLLLKYTPLATRSPQMLLVPVDTDVGHADEVYAGAHPRRSDDAHLDPAMMSGVKPSVSLLAGVDFNDDDDEVTDGEVENDQSYAPAESFGHGGASAEPAEWEHIPPPGALQVETAAVQSAVSQHEQENVEPTSTGGCASSQRVFGKWRATNVLRQGSVPGILYLFEESLVFESERHEIEDSEEAAAGLQQHAGQTWRWRLERLTQVTMHKLEFAWS